MQEYNVVHYTTCPICGSEMLNKVFDVKDFSVSFKTFAIVECAQCSVRLTQDAPVIEQIVDYYKSNDYISHTNTKKGIVAQLYHRVRKITLKKKKNLLLSLASSDNPSLLDVGAGVGAFAATLKAEGWAVTALEPDASARATAKKDFSIDLLPIEALYSLPANSFDMITLWHVLEHVHHLQEYLHILRKLLKPHGKLLVAVPNYTSYDALYYKEHWAAYDVPRHLYHFSPTSMERLMQKHHLAIVQTLPMKFDAYYVSLLSEKYKTGYNNLFSAFLVGLKSNLIANGEATKYSSVIYIMEKEEK